MAFPSESGFEKSALNPRTWERYDVDSSKRLNSFSTNSSLSFFT